ncbi:universal stress protein [Nocardioides sp.]|uniref:universal stress protein n=1 Tax=Nocardioides sp. TaxID=35761 RepID=UPI0035648A4E
MNQPENAIVVAVGPQGSVSALVFAVAEARRSGRPLHVVHVLQIHAGEAYAGVYGGALEVAAGILETATAKAHILADGDVPVTSELVDHGTVILDMIERSKNASLIVLEHRRMNRIRRLVTGSIANGVAAKAHAPVVSVPEGWHPVAGAHHVVTVAVQEPAGEGAQLVTAFEAAQERSAALVIMHAWWLGHGYDVVTMDKEFNEEWQLRTNEDIEPVLAPLRQRFPDVQVTVSLRHSPPAEAILKASETSDLVVIGRRHHTLPMWTHLGPVARAILARSSAPVMVTLESEHAPTP